jgi:hypothetical protein
MKVIFLDIDGPISWGTWYDGRLKIDKFTIPYPWVQKECDALSEIISKTDTKIVISSDWRHNYTVEQFGKIFEFYGIPNNVIDVTDMIKYKLSSSPQTDRAYQILKWVGTNKEQIESWVAVDDLKLDKHFEMAKINDWPAQASKDNFVWVIGDNSDINDRLSDKVEHIINLLNKSA